MAGYKAAAPLLRRDFPTSQNMGLSIVGRKRRWEDILKPTRHVRRKLRGSLECMPDMPIDVLIEVCH